MAGIIYRGCLKCLSTWKTVNITIKPSSLYGKTFKRTHSSSNWAEKVSANKLKAVYKSRKHASLNGEFLKYFHKNMFRQF